MLGRLIHLSFINPEKIFVCFFLESKLKSIDFFSWNFVTVKDLFKFDLIRNFPMILLYRIDVRFQESSRGFQDCFGESQTFQESLGISKKFHGIYEAFQRCFMEFQEIPEGFRGISESSRWFPRGLTDVMEVFKSISGVLRRYHPQWIFRGSL